MNKEANTDYPVHPLVSKRWSPRAFSEEPVSREILLRLFEAARWSPSSSNQQPWTFILSEKGEPGYEAIYNSLVEFNQLWAKFAPVLVVACGKKNSDKDGKPNRSYAYDTGQAVAWLTVQATHEGLYVHQMGGFEKELLVAGLNIPVDYEVLTVIAIGSIGDPGILHPNLKVMELKERERKSVTDFVFSGKFGESLK